jgi:hypothetical protein
MMPKRVGGRWEPIAFQIGAYSMIFIFLENGDNNDNKPKKLLI